MASTIVDSPIGPLGLIASEEALRAVLFNGGRIRPEGSSPVLAEAARQLDAYFEGDLVSFDLPLELLGTEFQRGCWLALASTCSAGPPAATGRAPLATSATSSMKKVGCGLPLLSCHTMPLIASGTPRALKGTSTWVQTPAWAVTETAVPAPPP